MALKYSPTITFEPKVHAYLEHAFGAARLQQMSAALCRPSLQTCLRVNSTVTTPQAVLQQLQQLLPGSQPYVHPVVPSAVILPGSGPLPLDLEACGGAEVVVNRLAGEAVLQGAHVFAPGLLAASPGLAPGDLVAVTVAVEQPGGGWCGLNRGMKLTPQLAASLPGRRSLCVGVGRVLGGRRELFKQQQGMAVEMVQRVFDVQPCNGLLPGQVLLQSLPCVVAAQVLDPQPGSRVLDMCAAPGNKTSMLAQLMAGHAGSRLVALDRTEAKAARVRQLSEQWGVQGIVQAMVADATQLYQQHQRQEEEQLSFEGSSEADGDGVCSTSTSSSSSTTTSSSSRSSTTSSSSSQSSSHTPPRRAPPSQQQQQQQLSADVRAAVQHESFDAVLLDAPCSALGLRPRLLLGWTLHQLEALAGYQRALLASAVHVLRPGGSLVYCTCTINPGENEENVRYVLDKWSQMQLVQQPLVLGGPGLSGPGLLDAGREAPLVQRFDPGAGCNNVHGGGSDGDDTIGFFIAKFVKRASTPGL